MKKRTLLAVMAMLCLNINIKAQTSVSMEALKVGEKLPADVWNMPMETINSASPQVFLKDFKGKLIVFDFWATWCAPCVKKFPSLDSLQQEFGSDVKIFLVNSSIVLDTPEKMMTKLKGRQVPSIINDKVLKALFPHSYIPHCVWIGPKGDVLAITSSKFMTSTVFKEMLTTEVKSK